MIRSYSELSKLKTFEERYRYLANKQLIGEDTFGWDRYLNQALYRSKKWKKARDKVILRDNGCDLGIEDRVITDRVIVHHMNPITAEQIEDADPIIFDDEYLICVSPLTHNAIHYGDESLLRKTLPDRTPGDTCPWRVKEAVNGQHT